MKIDFKKLSKNELIQAFILSIICIYICLFFIECQQLSQKTFYFIIILGAMFNWLPRKEDSTFGQVRIPLITSFAVIMNKIITAINLITNPETVEIFDSEDLHFENSLLMMVFCGVFINKIIMGFR